MEGYQLSIFITRVEVVVARVLLQWSSGRGEACWEVKI